MRCSCPGTTRRTATTRRARATIVERFSPIVVAASIDEHYLDFTGCERLYRRRGDGDDVDDDAIIVRVVREMTAAIDRELGLPASAGIATTKSMAKVASGLAKPQGVLLVRAGSEAATLAPLAGAQAARHRAGRPRRGCSALGIATLGQLVAAPEAMLRPIFGAYTAGHPLAARGDRHRRARSRAARVSRARSARRRRRHDLERAHVRRDRRATPRREVLSGLCERVGSRARRRGVVAGQRHAQAALHRLRHDHARPHDRADERRLRAPPRRARAVSRGAHARSCRSACSASRSRSSGSTPSSSRCSMPASGAGIAVDRVRDSFGYDAVHLATTLRRRRR